VELLEERELLVGSWEPERLKGWLCWGECCVVVLGLTGGGEEKEQQPEAVKYFGSGGLVPIGKSKRARRGKERATSTQAMTGTESRGE
jgi:hypothetical protein